MKVKELIKYLEKLDKDREVVVHEYAGGKSLFFSLVPSATNNTKNLAIFTYQPFGALEPIMKAKEKKKEGKKNGRRK